MDIMNLSIVGFDWDAGNRHKCRRHGLTVDEIEGLFRSEIKIISDVRHSKSETRFIAVGRSGGGRYVLVGFTFRKIEDNLLIRPITARHMHRKEVLRYEKTTS